MSFINTYKPLDPATIDLTPKEPYDLNCNIPLPPFFETDRVKLVPYIPHSIYDEPFISAYNASPEFGQYLPMSISTVKDLHFSVEAFVRPDAGAAIFVILDKTKPNYDSSEGIKESLAGLIGYLFCSPTNLKAEIGPVIILPSHQRTFVSSHAIGLLMGFFLDTPSQGTGGLGFRRLEWKTSPFNEASLRAAERMGFVKEGVQRWSWVLPDGKKGKEVPGGERGKGDGRDNVLLAVCWDDWEGGVREAVLEKMRR